MSDTVWILSDPSKKHIATKRHKADGKTEAYGKATWFEATPAKVSSLEELSTLLTTLESYPYSFVVRGEPISGRNPQRIRRTNHAHAGEPPGFTSRPRRWLMVDVDNIPGQFELRTVEGVDSAIQSAAKWLGLPSGTGFHWQLSSSAGLKSGLSVHFWFWLDRPVEEKELQRWAEVINDERPNTVDPAVFRVVQPHYTATPIFDPGRLDIVARRSGQISGTEFHIPNLTARGDDWKRALLPLYDAGNTDIHNHILGAATLFFAARGPKADVSELRRTVLEGVERATTIQGRDEYPAAEVDRVIESLRESAGERDSANLVLITGSDGRAKGTVDNAYKLLRADPELYTKWKWNSRARRIEQTPSRIQFNVPEAVQLSVELATTHGVSFSTAVLREAVETVAREHAYDPALEYLQSLNWDGTPRASDVLVRLASANSEMPYIRRATRLWLLNAVKRVFEPGSQSDYVLVLQGPQGAGKTSFLRTLARRPEWFLELHDMREEKAVELLGGPWIVDLSELTAVRKRDMGATNSFLTRTYDSIRLPWHPVPEQFPRCVVFAASTNETEWLEDASGGRRWLPVDVSDFDLDMLEEEADQIWAEIVLAYESGEAAYVSADDEVFVSAQKEIRVNDSRQQIVEHLLTVGGDGVLAFETVRIPANAREVTVSDILTVGFNDVRQTRGDQMAVAAILKRMGWIRTSTLTGKVWVRPAARHVK